MGVLYDGPPEYQVYDNGSEMHSPFEVLETAIAWAEAAIKEYPYLRGELYIKETKIVWRG